MNHHNSALRNESLAEAALPPGGATKGHYHVKAEEIYYILQGQALMRLDGKERPVREGDAIAIAPGQKHKICNTGFVPLVFLCCCAPAYEHEDTILLE